MRKEGNPRGGVFIAEVKGSFAQLDARDEVHGSRLQYQEACVG